MEDFEALAVIAAAADEVAITGAAARVTCAVTGGEPIEALTVVVAAADKVAGTGVVTGVTFVVPDVETDTIFLDTGATIVGTGVLTTFTGGKTDLSVVATGVTATPFLATVDNIGFLLSAGVVTFDEDVLSILCNGLRDFLLPGTETVDGVDAFAAGACVNTVGLFSVGLGGNVVGLEATVMGGTSGDFGLSAAVVGLG